MSSLLDMVKVMQYAISQGKVAIHCHAGKGNEICLDKFSNKLCIHIYTIKMTI